MEYCHNFIHLKPQQTLHAKLFSGFKVSIFVRLFENNKTNRISFLNKEEHCGFVNASIL